MLEMQTDKTNTYDLNVVMQNIFTEKYFNSTFRDFTCKAILLSILLIWYWNNKDEKNFHQIDDIDDINLWLENVIIYLTLMIFIK